MLIAASCYCIHISSTPTNELEGRLSSFVSQILSSMRTVQTFTMEASVMSSLEARFLQRLEALGKTRAIARAVEQAGVFFAVFITHSLAFWIIGIEVVKGADLGYAMTVSSRTEAERKLLKIQLWVHVCSASGI